MYAVIIAFLLPLLLGRFLSFLAFVIVWLAGIVAYAIWLFFNDSSLLQNVFTLITAGVAAQVGYFANIFLRSMFDRGDDGPTP